MTPIKLLKATILGVEFSWDPRWDNHEGWQFMLAGFPDLNASSYVISDNNSRQLSYEEDALPGITGLLSVLSRTFANGFLCGLPDMLFDRALRILSSLHTRTNTVYLLLNEASSSFGCPIFCPRVMNMEMKRISK
jgi:hypothetical protein